MGLSLKVPARFAPRPPRIAVAIETTLLLPDDAVAAVAIRNISADGFMGLTEAVLPPESWAGIEIPGCGIIPCQVRWSADGEIGAQFRRPLDLDRIDHEDVREGKVRSTLYLARVLRGIQ